MEELSAAVKRLPTPRGDSSRSYCEVVKGGAQDDASKRRKKFLHQAANGGFVVPPKLSKTAHKQIDSKLFGHNGYALFLSLWNYTLPSSLNVLASSTD